MRTAIILEEKDLDLTLLDNNNLIFHRGPAGQRINGIYWSLWYKPEQEVEYFEALKFAHYCNHRLFKEVELTPENAHLIKNAMYAMKYAINTLRKYRGEETEVEPYNKFRNND